MSKENFLDKVFHDMNDYNYDGKVDELDELRYWNDVEEENEKELLSHNDWRLDCEDGSEYDLDTYDFDDEDEYDEALEAAENSDDDYCDDDEDDDDYYDDDEDDDDYYDDDEDDDD